MPERPSLAGRRVLLTRAPDAARAWVAALEARGAVAEPREVFVLEPVVSDELRDAVAGIGRYAWIVVTSANGSRFLRAALSGRGTDLRGVPGRFAVVGPQTQAAIESAGVRAAVVAGRADATGLGDALAPHLGAGDRVLVVRPEVSRPGLTERLQSAGARVDSVAFYRNRAAAGVAEIVREWFEGAFDAAVLSSPSSFGYLRDAAGEQAPRLASVPLVAIGETTAAAIRDGGHLVAAVALRPTPEGIVDAVERALST